MILPDGKPTRPGLPIMAEMTSRTRSRLLDRHGGLFVVAWSTTEACPSRSSAQIGIRRQADNLARRRRQFLPLADFAGPQH